MARLPTYVNLTMQKGWCGQEPLHYLIRPFQEELLKLPYFQKQMHKYERRNFFPIRQSNTHSALERGPERRESLSTKLAPKEPVFLLSSPTLWKVASQTLCQILL